MDINKLKQEIIRKITETDDVILLYTINQMLNQYSINGSINEVNESPVHYGLAIDESIMAYRINGLPSNQRQFQEEVLSIIEK